MRLPSEERGAQAIVGRVSFRNVDNRSVEKTISLEVTILHVIGFTLPYVSEAR